MPYRDELGALRQRHDRLLAQVGALRAEEARLTAATNRRQALEADLGQLTQRIRELQRKRGQSPTLDDVRLASPCSAKWDNMVGDERVRYCAQCQKDVFNISAMSRAEAEALIADSHHASPEKRRRCLRIHRRSDGTILTSDCPVGRRRRRVTRMVGAAMAATGAGAALIPTTPPLRAEALEVAAPEVLEPVVIDEELPEPPRRVHRRSSEAYMGF